MALQLLGCGATMSGLIKIFLSYFKHHVSMRTTTYFLTGLLEKLSITADNEIPKSLRSFCHEKLIYSQMFTGNPHSIRWASRFAAGFAWPQLCFESSLWLERWYFYFIDGKLDRRVMRLILTLSLGAEIGLRSDNYFCALAARQHIWRNAAHRNIQTIFKYLA